MYVCMYVQSSILLIHVYVGTFVIATLWFLRVTRYANYGYDQHSANVMLMYVCRYIHTYIHQFDVTYMGNHKSSQSDRYLSELIMHEKQASLINICFALSSMRKSIIFDLDNSGKGRLKVTKCVCRKLAQSAQPIFFV
jgi:hypothetical protein